MGIDIWEVIDAAKTKPFGFMPFYPGPGVGGHCIPLDPYYLTWKAREFNLDTRFIELAGQIIRGMPFYVVSHLVEGLNLLSLPIQGVRILILGLSYKPNIPDDRESPSYDIMNILKEKGAEVDYYDSFIPVIKKHAGPQWAGRHSITWNPETLASYTAAVVCTPHKGVNYSELAEHIPLIVDACNIVPKNSKAHVIAA